MCVSAKSLRRALFPRRDMGLVQSVWDIPKVTNFRGRGITGDRGEYNVCWFSIGMGCMFIILSEGRVWKGGKEGGKEEGEGGLGEGGIGALMV